jgi:hypothetical protein
LQYFVEKLKSTGHEALILMDANQAEEQAYQQQTQNIIFDEEGIPCGWNH